MAPPRRSVARSAAETTSQRLRRPAAAGTRRIRRARRAGIEGFRGSPGATGRPSRRLRGRPHDRDSSNRPTSFGPYLRAANRSRSPPIRHHRRRSAWPVGCDPTAMAFMAGHDAAVAGFGQHRYTGRIGIDLTLALPGPVRVVSRAAAIAALPARGHRLHFGPPETRRGPVAGSVDIAGAVALPPGMVNRNDAPSGLDFSGRTEPRRRGALGHRPKSRNDGLHRSIAAASSGRRATRHAGALYRPERPPAWRPPDNLYEGDGA